MKPYDRLADTLEKFPSPRSTLNFVDGRGRRTTVFACREAVGFIGLMHHKHGCIALKYNVRHGWRTNWKESVPFFKWFLCQNYEIAPALIDQVEALFEHEEHLFRPVQVRLAYGYSDHAGRKVHVVCTIFNAAGSDEYTVRIEHRGEYKSLRDCMVFLLKDESSVTGSSATGNVGTLVWFLNQPFKLTRAGRIGESCDQYIGGAADWTIPCSDFYFIRAGHVGDMPRQMSPEMRHYVGDPALFRLSDEIREYVLAICSRTHVLNGREENLTIRRLFTKEDKAGGK